jgi:anti-sigma B factor antagonist
MALEISEIKRDGAIVLNLKGDLDSNTSGLLEEKLLDLIQAGEGGFVIDCLDLQYISSAGFRVLLKVMKELKSKGGRLSLCSLKDYIREVFDLSGFILFIPVHPSIEEALEYTIKN